MLVPRALIVLHKEGKSRRGRQRGKGVDRRHRPGGIQFQDRQGAVVHVVRFRPARRLLPGTEPFRRVVGTEQRSGLGGAALGSVGGLADRLASQPGKVNPTQRSCLEREVGDEE
jgi:hypothetical protein